MTNRMIVRSLLVTLGVAVVLCAAAGRASAQVPSCNPETNPGCVCLPSGTEFPDVCAIVGQPIMCAPPTPTGTFCGAPFTPDADTWNLVFGPNNAIKLSTNVMCPGFALLVQAFRISQADYIPRRAPAFGDTVCNPTADGVTTDCVFYRLHGEFVDPMCYPTAANSWDYSVFWNMPPIQGNKHDWMLLRARCSETPTDTNVCDNTQLFSDNVTVMVEKKPPVGTDPVVRGSGDGISDFIVAISTRHPHKIPPLFIP
jgi:hypothetical protein